MKEIDPVTPLTRRLRQVPCALTAKEKLKHPDEAELPSAGQATQIEESRDSSARPGSMAGWKRMKWALVRSVKNTFHNRNGKSNEASAVCIAKRMDQRSGTIG